MPQIHRLLFLLAVVIHNCEEGVLLPGWSESGKGFAVVHPLPFALTLVIITVPLILFALPKHRTERIDLLLTGYAGMMFLNCFFPHAAATLFLKELTPGTISSLLFVFPSSLALLRYAATSFSMRKIVGSTGATATVTISLILLSYNILSRFTFPI